jgi:hypothetical protein
VHGDVAVRLHHDVGAAAVSLGHVLVIPGLVAPVGLDDVHLAPPGFDELLAALGDGGVLQPPELLRIDEVPLLAEQVGGDTTLIRRLIEQCCRRRNLRAAKQPGLELPRRWRLLLGIVVERQPRLLALLRCQR